MMMDFMGMMKQAQAMQAKMAETQAELEQTIVEGEAGGGLVKITLNAKGELKKLSIDPSLLKPEEREILEDLIVSAHAQARAKGDEAMAEKMKALTGGLQLPPGMKLPF
jgi:DNA-binding YbaB/EbfC family protein